MSIPGCRCAPGRWEPPDAAKGRIARAVLYMACAYAAPPLGLRLSDNLDSTKPGSKSLGRKAALLEWHRRFPPTAKEVKRNDAVEAIQGNRNPFVDDPSLADIVAF